MFILEKTRIQKDFVKGSQGKTYWKLVFVFNMYSAPKNIYSLWGREKGACFAKLTHRQILDNPHAKPPARHKSICKLLHLIPQVTLPFSAKWFMTFTIRSLL